MKKLTKKQQVKHYLSTGRTITPREAIDLFQAYRLAAIVSDLKKQGMKIVNLQKQFGVNYGVYKVVDSGENLNLFTNIKRT